MCIRDRLQVDSAKPQAQPRREGMHVVTVPHPEAIGKSPIHNSQFEDCKLRIFSLFLHFLADGGKRLKSRNNILNDNQGAAQERAALRPEHPAARGRHRMPQGRKNAKAMSEIIRLEPVSYTQLDETVAVGEESHRSHADVVDVFVRTLLVYHLPSSLQFVHENFQMVLKPVDTVETESAGRRPDEEGEILVALREMCIRDRV